MLRYRMKRLNLAVVLRQPVSFKIVLNKYFLLLLIVCFSLPVFAEESLSPNVCLKEGETSSVGGIPGNDGWKLNPPCCQGLIDRESIRVCGTGYAGGYVYACLKCGDKICDSKSENNCNCREDCSNSQ